MNKIINIHKQYIYQYYYIMAQLSLPYNNDIFYKYKGGHMLPSELSILLSQKNMTWRVPKSTEATCAIIKTILNKLADDNFDILLIELMSLELNNEQAINELVNNIYQKAINEKMFTKLYVKLSKKLINVKYDENITYKKCLLNKCQNIFEDYLKNENYTDKDIILGCVNLIGELYLEDLLSEKIIKGCIQLVMKKITNTMDNCQQHPFIIDVLCCLLFIVFEKLNIKDNIFGNKIKKIIMNDIYNLHISQRDKFKITDLIDFFNTI